MDWFRNLKIGSKLLSAFGVVVGLTVVLGVVASTRLLDIKREANVLGTNYVPGLVYIAKISEASAMYRREVTLSAVTDVPALKAEMEANARLGRARMQE